MRGPEPLPSGAAQGKAQPEVTDVEYEEVVDTKYVHPRPLVLIGLDKGQVHRMPLVHRDPPSHGLAMNTATKTRVQIAAEYGVSPRTLSRWLKRRDIRLSRGLLGQPLGKPAKGRISRGEGFWHGESEQLLRIWLGTRRVSLPDHVASSCFGQILGSSFSNVWQDFFSGRLSHAWRSAR